MTAPSPRRWLAQSGAAVAGVARNPDLRRLEIALAGSVLAHWAYGVAIAVYAYGEGGATAVGIFGLVRMLPSAVAAPFTAALADRYPRTQVLAAAASLRSLGAAATAVAVAWDGPEALVYALAAVVQIATTASFPAKAALMPSLARTPTELTAANVVSTTVESIGSFIGPALGGVILALGSVEAALVATAVSFFASALLVVRIRFREVAAERSRLRLSSAELLGGIRAIRAGPGVPLLVTLYGAQTLVAGALNVLIVVLALDVLELGLPAVGYLDAAIGVGGIVGSVVVLARAARTSLRADFVAGLLLWGIPLASLAVVDETVVAIALLAVIGVGNTVVDVAGITLLQRAVPDRALARVFGVLESLTWGTIGLGAAGAAIAVDLAGERGAFVVAGALLPALVLLSWQRLAAIDAAVLPPSRELAAVDAVPMFTPLAPDVRDRLAVALVPVRFPAGAVVVRQGEAGDRFYLIERGRAAVDVDGRPGAALGPGDFFGEIALVRGVPRTATVTAVEELEGYAIERADFVAAVGGHPAARGQAEAVVGARLRSLRPEGASL